MSEVATRWPRELWEAASKATSYRLARLCPLCPDPAGTQVTVQGLGTFNIPIGWNAKSFTITIAEGASDSTVVWEPCGHTVVVDGRLDERHQGADPVRPDEEPT
ncbi:hypothetical protein ABZV65_19520 [Streptomyces bauhiniae]|uniref:hypothetical protein n=1 Tax=Streptomyces bauhiniae TaxID=2340725 RepID=UPI0033B6E3AF